MLLSIIILYFTVKLYLILKLKLETKNKKNNEF